MSQRKSKFVQEQSKAIYVEKEQKLGKSKKKQNKNRNKSLTAFYPSNIETQPSSYQSQIKHRISQQDQAISQINKLIPINLKKLEKVKQNALKQKLKSQLALSKIFTDQYTRKRAQKQIGNQSIGRFIPNQNGTLTFVQGRQYTKAYTQLIEIKSLKQSLDIQKNKKQRQLRKSKNKQSSQCLKFKLSVYNRAYEDSFQKFQKIKIQIQLQRLRAKLAKKQTNSFLAKMNWPLINKKYQTLELIGSGGFGQVYRVFDMSTLQYYALKISMPDPCQQQSQIQNFIKHSLRQQEIHSKLQHKNIAKVHEIIHIENTQKFVIATVLQLCQGPDLSQYIKQRKTLQQQQAKYIIKQVLQALVYMNKLDQKIIHYDLKPQNILMNKGQIKVIDFGLCKVLDKNQDEIELTSIGTGTSWYLPPETFQTIINPQLDMSINENNCESISQQKVRKVSTRIDIWALGVIFFQFLYGQKPYCNSMSQNQIWDTGIMKNLKQVKFPNNKNNKIVSQKAKDFIKCCLQSDQTKRLQVKNALSHPYFIDVQP